MGGEGLLFGNSCSGWNHSGKYVYEVNIQGTIALGDFHGGQFSGRQFPEGKRPEGDCLGGNFIACNCSGVSCSGGIVQG